MKNLLTILILSTLMIIGCNGNSAISNVSDEAVILTSPVADASPDKTAAGDGTLMSETELIEYFASLYIIENFDLGDPIACDIWWIVYEFILHTQLAHDDFVFNMVEMYENDGQDIPDYINIHPPC
jgi:hypothetical protein